MIDYRDKFHVGMLVPDLGAAMAEMGPVLGVTWAEARHVADQAVWTPDRGLHRVELRFVYSCEGPEHVELVEGEPGSVWDGSGRPGVHHVGLWVDDVAAGVAECLDGGWQVALAHAAPGDDYGLFAYMAPPSGPLVELVSARMRPAFEAWWAAGSPHSTRG